MRASALSKDSGLSKLEVRPLRSLRNGAYFAPGILTSTVRCSVYACASNCSAERGRRIRRPIQAVTMTIANPLAANARRGHWKKLFQEEVTAPNAGRVWD